MKLSLLLLSAFLSCLMIQAQVSDKMLAFEPSADHPFGQINPNAPAETADFAPMIGICDCWSLRRNPDQTWADTIQMVWKFTYIMNGHAIQDESWRNGNVYTGSIRQFHADSSQWVVTFFSYPGVSTSPGVWLGKKEGKNIVLKMPQPAPNGMEGVSRLTFYDMSEEGYQWKGEWVSQDESIIFPFWRIGCQKRK